MNLFENLFTPPSEEKKQALEAEKAKLKAEHDMQDALADALAKAMLESNLPEHRKVGVRLVMKAKKARNSLNSLVHTYANPNLNEEKEKEIYPAAQEACDFIDHLESELKDFLSSHPLPVEM